MDRHHRHFSSPAVTLLGLSIAIILQQFCQKANFTSVLQVSRERMLPSLTASWSHFHLGKKKKKKALCNPNISLCATHYSFSLVSSILNSRKNLFHSSLYIFIFCCQAILYDLMQNYPPSVGYNCKFLHILEHKCYAVELISTFSTALRKLDCSLSNTIHDALFPMALCLG